MLSDDERNRSARFRFEKGRRRFVVARGALRELLGRYLGTDPGQIRFTYNAFGKPELHPDFGDRLKFNLAHSGDLTLIAIARDADVGVDVECIEGRGESSYAPSSLSRGTPMSASMSNASRGAVNRATLTSHRISSRQQKLTR